MASTFESLFEFLFKYRPLIYQKGHFTLGASWPLYLLGVLILVAAVPVVLRYRRVRGKSRVVDRVLLTALRVSALALVLFCLLQPALVLSTVVPQRSFVGILLDDSKSMQIADEGGVARGRFLADHFGPEGSPLLEALADKFKLRMFGFSSTAERVEDASALTFRGARTHLGQVLERAADELATVPLAGLVLASDGADNSYSGLNEALLALKARGVPVYTLGLGREQFTKDIELTRVDAPRTVLKGSSVVVDVAISQKGFSGLRVRLDIEDSGRIVNSREIELPEEGETATVRAHFTASEAGARSFRFRVAPQLGEMVTQNNQRETLIHVQDHREKILYFEGEPRFELKFIRRAVADDENLQVVCLQRTAENKYLRLDVDDAEELASGFPKTREELFQYKGLILGSVEASYFTHDQLQMIADFVSQRGGGLLTLGGRLAFSMGGYAGTPVADVLPVVLEDGGRVSGSGEPFFGTVNVALTPVGRTHPVTQFDDDMEENAKRWAELPPLSILNSIQRVKPGATTLLVGNQEEPSSEQQVVLAFQRYGRGRALAFTVHDSWQWQMHAEIPLEDMTHEILWRKLLRWLVSYVPDRVAVTTARDRFAPGESVAVTAEVEDDRFLKVNNARVVAEVKHPSGKRIDLPMEWTVDKDGEYRSTFVPEEKGLYEISIQAEREGAMLGTATTYLEATDLADEYFNAEMRSELLRRIGEETGGRYYTPETASRMAEDMSYTEGGTTILERKDLWDMPAVFLLLVTLIGIEWGYRKARGLA
jgi:uncharacterized membrane protein